MPSSGLTVTQNKKMFQYGLMTDLYIILVSFCSSHKPVFEQALIYYPQKPQYYHDHNFQSVAYSKILNDSRLLTLRTGLSIVAKNNNF